ncbi:mechanosensitive ion channel family protein [Thermaurantiacus sp.]
MEPDIRMIERDVTSLSDRYLPLALDFGLKVLGALVLFMAGRWLIGLGIRMLERLLTARSFDATLQRYVASILAVTLNIVLVVAILGYFGIETTSFAALLAGVGLAVGAAWSGLLGNFAAGAFLIIFRPYKVGDHVVAGDVEGTVTEIGLFNTIITTPDHVQAIVGNAKISGEILKNYSTLPHRRVDRTMQLAHGVDPLAVIEALKPRIAAIPNVLSEPAPTIEILDFNELGTVLAVRPHCHTLHYWQVWFDTNRAIVATGKALGLPPPFNVERDTVFERAA